MGILFGTIKRRPHTEEPLLAALFGVLCSYVHILGILRDLRDRTHRERERGNIRRTCKDRQRLVETVLRAEISVGNVPNEPVILAPGAAFR